MNYDTGETIEESFTYDAAGNIITATDNCCDTDSFSYDKNNRLIGTNANAYTYNAENVRIRNLCGDSDTTYVYNTNAKLSSMLMKTTDGVVTKYVYGRGLIGEETNGVFKTYHFDYRGSTVAITDINGDVTDTFEYDTYGKVINRAGNSDVILLHNGRVGVVTDSNGLVYMRARYYSPELRRFINADILAGSIDNAVTLNRYAYANANPVSLIDPRGLSAERGRGSWLEDRGEFLKNAISIDDALNIMWDGEKFHYDFENITVFEFASEVMLNEDALDLLYSMLKDAINTSARPSNMGKREWNRIVTKSLEQLDNLYGPTSKLAKGLKAAPYMAIIFDAVAGGIENAIDGEDIQEIATDASIDLVVGAGSTLLSGAVSSMVSSAVAGTAVGSVAPGIGNLIGMAAGAVVGIGMYVITDVVNINGKSFTEWLDELM